MRLNSLAEETLHDVALGIEFPVQRALLLSAGLGRDRRNRPGFGDMPEDGVGVVSLVGDDCGSSFKIFQKFGGVAGLLTGRGAQAAAVDRDMDFGGRPPATATDILPGQTCACGRAPPNCANWLAASTPRSLLPCKDSIHHIPALLQRL